MIRKKKLYSRPRKLYIKTRISQENALVKRYGLKNKTEIWKALAKIKYFRKRAMTLAKSSNEEQKILFDKLKIIGLNTNTIADVLALNVENILERRLPTIVFKKKLASTPQHARQLVVHKKVLVDGKIINVPSYIVSVAEEALISFKPGKKKELVEKKAEIAESMLSEEIKEQENK
jgi:small subunit ribosomal protein S4